MVAVVIALLVYTVDYYCMSVPLSRHSQLGDSAAGMMVASSEDAAEETDNREGKYMTNHRVI